MPTLIDHRASIASALRDFQSRSLATAARGLLNALGYKSDRTISLPQSSPQAFLDLVHENASDASFNEEKAHCADWRSADLLFQLTDDELSGQKSLFKETEVNSGLLRSYIFFAIELDGENYARGKLTGIARQINHVFPMPVMVLIKSQANKQSVLSIAVINRRQSKRDAARDVLGKVTIIRDISLSEPHRGHLDILDSFALDNLVHPQRLPINNFDTLHAAWEEIFNVELLNKEFYKKLQRWYFWALPQVEFPDDLEPDAKISDPVKRKQHAEKRRATSLIRLLTRLIFCWFLKEKGLIPEKLFVEAELKKVLKDLSPDASTYNEAILQNLFFATLNQRMGKDAKGQPFRAFAKDEGFQRNRTTYGVDTFYRYEEHFRGPATALDQFADVPFLNGGLFECLDRTEEGNDRKLYLDGFSRNKEKRPTVPNRLFFGSGEIEIGEVTGEKKKGKVEALGLLRILHSYKFTIVENTPIDQEIALDPELLGKVFENLLASYNEETKTNARKQTGSFYTPRPIVEYMVDESLKAHLTGALTQAGMSEKDVQTGLDILFAYTERKHPFTDAESDSLIRAIYACKVLDPACGSGAFPMGMLHKMVYVLAKLDPRNERLEQIKIDEFRGIEDPDERRKALADIVSNFKENNDDYGRKLYLIENCLYGVDIQPIAIQISKLRFFISLVCDQRINRNKKENLGIRPLPNLETKFVAADTLVGLPRTNEPELVSSKVYKIESEIEALYHGHFAIQRRDQKLALQKKIKDLRKELGKLLAESLGSSKKAQHVADWDPFDPQATSDFFDPHWMFGRSLADGFDIVLGNPPYLKERDSKHVFDLITRTPWGAKYHEGKMDYWYFFLHRAFEITKPEGIVSFITSRYWINSAGSKKLVRHIRKTASLFHVVDIGSLPVFELVAGHHMLHFYRLNEHQGTCRVKKLENTLDDIALSVQTESLAISDQSPTLLFTSSDEIKLYEATVQILSTLTVADCFDVSQGVVQNPDKVSTVMSKRYGLMRGEGVFVLEDAEIRQLRLNAKENAFVKPFYDEASISPFHLERREGKHLLYITKKNCPTLHGMPNIERHLSHYREIMDARRETVNGTIEWFQLHWPRDPRFFESDKVVLPSMFRTPAAAYVPEPAYFGLGSNVVIGGRGSFNLRVLASLLNSSVGTWWFLTNSKKRGVGVDVGVDRLRQFPLPAYTAMLAVVDALVKMITFGLSTCGAEASNRFLHDLVDACVMECYFREHMAERDLLFLDDLAPHLSAYDSGASDSQQREYISQIYRTLNAPRSNIRNRLLRISADSPDLLAVIKKEGAI